jgi:Ring finger domain
MDLQALLTRPRPASVAAIKSLTRQVVDQGWLNSHSDEECAICTDPYILGNVLTDQRCGHIFHQECLSTWLRKNGNCPSCRDNLNSTHTRAMLGYMLGPQRISSKHDTSRLALTAAEGNKDTVETLLAQVDIEVDSKDAIGKTPLMWVA